MIVQWNHSNSVLNYSFTWTDKLDNLSTERWSLNLYKFVGGLPVCHLLNHLLDTPWPQCSLLHGCVSVLVIAFFLTASTDMLQSRVLAFKESNCVWWCFYFAMSWTQISPFTRYPVTFFPKFDVCLLLWGGWTKISDNWKNWITHGIIKISYETQNMIRTHFKIIFFLPS